MEFKQLVEVAEKWCSSVPFDLIFAEEDDERRLDFYAETGISFYVLCPDNMTGGVEHFVSVCSRAHACVVSVFWGLPLGSPGAVCVCVCATGMMSLHLTSTPGAHVVLAALYAATSFICKQLG